MSRTFDPYHQWLGIRPEEHPVDHYRLLGIVRFESDRDVIANACDRLMSHVRKFQTGPRWAYTQEVLTRLSAARACLLDHGAKRTYDAVLEGQMAAAASAQAAHAQRAAPMASVYEPAMAVMPPPPTTTPLAPAAPPLGQSAYAAHGPSPPRALEQVEYVENTFPFYLQPWFPVLVVAGVLLVALSVWGLALILGASDGETVGDANGDTPQIETPPAIVEPAADDEPDDEAVVILQEAGGELNFTAGTAMVEGNPQLGDLQGQSIISGITSAQDRIRWNFRVENPGPFRIEATYAAPPGSEGGTFTLTAGEQTTKPITVRNTGGAGEFTSERVGFLWIRRSGKHELVLAPQSLVDGHSLLTLQSLRLVPVRGG